MANKVDICDECEEEVEDGHYRDSELCYECYSETHCAKEDCWAEVDENADRGQCDECNRDDDSWVA